MIVAQAEALESSEPTLLYISLRLYGTRPEEEN